LQTISKELLSHFQTRSKELKERYVSLLKIYEKTILEMENIEDENRYFKQLTDKSSKKPLSEKDIALQDFIVHVYEEFLKFCKCLNYLNTFMTMNCIQYKKIKVYLTSMNIIHGIDFIIHYTYA